MGLYGGVEELQSPMVRRIWDWWIASGRSGVPDRAEFDPENFKDLLPNILICDVEDSPFRIRYRLVGTRIAEATGFNITGRYLDELLPTEPEAPWQDLYLSSYKTRVPAIGNSTCTTTSGALFTHEYGLFPLRRGGDRIAQFLAIEDYQGLVSELTDLVRWQTLIPAAS